MGRTRNSTEFANSVNNCLALTVNFHHKKLGHDFEALFDSKDSSGLLDVV